MLTQLDTTDKQGRTLYAVQICGKPLQIVTEDDLRGLNN